MRDVKRTLIHLGVLYLLLALNIPLNVLPAQFLRAGLSSIYLMGLSMCMFLGCYLRVAEQGRMKNMTLLLSANIFLLFLLRCVKYTALYGTAARYAWYLYYAPMLIIPTCLFYIACYLFSADQRQVWRQMGWAAVISAVCILAVLTNDLHQQVFRFAPGMVNWSDDYSYGWAYIVLTVWEYLLFIAAVVAMIVKSAIAGIQNRAALAMVPVVIGVLMIALILAGGMPEINGHRIIQFPEAFGFMAAGILECSMQLGLIPTNESYRELMGVTAIPVQITDTAGKVIYSSAAASPLSEEQLRMADGDRIGAHTILRRMEIPGGCGFLQTDVTEPDRLSGELAEAQERLREESEMIRLQNELMEKRAKIEQRAAVYDDIARSVVKQSREISCLAERALHTEDPEEKDSCRRHIVLLGAYIKRRANLMLLSSGSGTLNFGDLGLSVAEVLRYLNLYGVPGDSMITASGSVRAEKALAVFEVFENILERHLGVLAGVFVNLSRQDGEFVLKLTLEQVEIDRGSEDWEKLEQAGVRTTLEQEDDIAYYCFAFGREAAV